MKDIDIQMETARTMMVNPRDIIPIRFAFESLDLRYLMVNPIKSGGRRTLTRYNPICDKRPVDGGFSFIFFPHIGQKYAVLSTGAEQEGQSA